MLSDNAWPGEVIATWDNLASRAADMSEKLAKGQRLLFRGQPCQWTLTPSLMRAMPRGSSFAAFQKAEKEALRHFEARAHLFAEERLTQDHINGSKELAWWTLMQHYGAPTRLMDWTKSPYVAAYFAVEQNPDDDGVVLVIDRSAIDDHFRRTSTAANGRAFHRTQTDPPALSTFTLHRKTGRVAIQQGYFMTATHPDCEHDVLLEEANAAVRRWIIPATLKPVVLRHLQAMNVTAQSLFPGLDGLGRSTREKVKTLIV